MSVININKVNIAVRLMREAFARHKSKIITMTILGFVSGALGGIGIGAVIPVFSFITNKATPNDAISRYIQTFFAYTHIPYNLSVLLTMVICIFIGKAIFLYWANYINSRLCVDYEEETRKELLIQTLGARWSYLLDQKIGFLEAIIRDEVYGSSSILMNITNIILAATSLITYALVAIAISIPITALTFALGIFLFFLLKPIYYRVRKLSQRFAETTKLVYHHINEHIIGIKTVKSMAIEDRVIAKSARYFRDLRNARLKLAAYSTIFNTFLEPISLIFVLIIFVVSYQSNNFNIAAFIAILYLIQKMFSFMQGIQTKLNGVNESLPYIKNMIEYQREIYHHHEQDHGSRPFVFNASLEFRNVSFAYSDSAPLLSDLSFTIKKGETIGIIGPSGAGKTTLVDLILRLFDCKQGAIALDDVNVNAIGLKAWRTNIGYVSQDMFVLNDTIANNIAFYSSSVTADDVVTAAKLANIYDFIQAQPQGLQTPVGERGVHLSGGQRQRLILARILARKPALLILDEATSALDNESEALIQTAIKNLHGTTTIIIIAHRLSTVMDADRLLTIDKGKLLEQGTPQQLLKNKNSYFARMHAIRD